MLGFVEWIGLVLQAEAILPGVTLAEAGWVACKAFRSIISTLKEFNRSIFFSFYFGIVVDYFFYPIADFTAVLRKFEAKVYDVDTPGDLLALFLVLPNRFAAKLDSSTSARVPKVDGFGVINFSFDFLVNLVCLTC